MHILSLHVRKHTQINITEWSNINIRVCHLDNFIHLFLHLFLQCRFLSLHHYFL